MPSRNNNQRKDSMKQLSRKEIVELRARAIYNALYFAEGGIWDAVETKDVWYNIAEATILADEQAGVLLLDENPKDADLIQNKYLPTLLYRSLILESGEILLMAVDGSDNGKYNDKHDRIIQRNSTPVYTTKKED